MGRPRKNPQDARLPKYVYLKKGRYVHVAPLGHGKLGRETVLAPGAAPTRQVWEAYERHTQADVSGTLRWLSERYLASAAFAKKAERTQRDYRRYHECIMQFPRKDGQPFGGTMVGDITPGVVVGYRDKRSDGADGAPVTANREMAYLSLIFSWGYERELVKANPVKGVKRNTERPRERLVEEWEYRVVYDLAATSPHYIRPAMELAYLCRLRKIEVLTFKRKDLDLVSEGVIARRRKGSRTQIVTWSDRLRDAIAACAGASTIASVYVIHDRRGQRILESTFDTAWQRLIVRAARHGLKERFTFHDLKAMGVSDFDGDKQRASGHRTASAAAIYDRKVEQIKPTK